MGVLLYTMCVYMLVLLVCLCCRVANAVFRHMIGGGGVSWVVDLVGVVRGVVIIVMPMLCMVWIVFVLFILLMLFMWCTFLMLLMLSVPMLCMLCYGVLSTRCVLVVVNVVKGGHVGQVVMSVRLLT